MKLVAVPFALLSIVALPCAADIVLRDAWIRAAPPSAVVLAGYATIENRGDRAVTLVGGASGAFGRVELHEMRMQDGVVKMRALERITIAPGETLELSPGATHLMLHSPRRALGPGETVTIELRDADGVCAAASFVVR